MSTIRHKLGKIFAYSVIFILAIALIASLVLLFLRTRELNGLKDTFAQATDQLNQANESKQITIADLKQEFDNLNKENSDLKLENTALKDQVSSLQQTGYGDINGKILPFVTNGVSDFSQFQLVCAESTANSNLQYCRTVSAIDQTFVLSVPAGSYKVYAQLFPTPAAGSALAGTKGYYTEYIKCVRESGSSKCDANKLKKPVNLTVKAGDSLKGIDPIDWQKS